MSTSTQMIYEYRCGGCRQRFEVVTIGTPGGFDRPAGYPEQQPECPTCHSHDAARVSINDIESQGHRS